jgi:hypothetical protein
MGYSRFWREKKTRKKQPEKVTLFKGVGKTPPKVEKMKKTRGRTKFCIFPNGHGKNSTRTEGKPATGGLTRRAPYPDLDEKNAPPERGVEKMPFF